MLIYHLNVRVGLVGAELFGGGKAGEQFGAGGDVVEVFVVHAFLREVFDDGVCGGRCNVFIGLPAAVFVSVSFPFDVPVSFAVFVLMGEDLFDFVLLSFGFGVVVFVVVGGGY